MNESFLPFFFVFEWLNEWDYCVIFVVELEKTVLCLFFSIRWKRQTGRLRWLTKHYLIILNFLNRTMRHNNKIWVSQIKSTRMWNHFDCRRRDRLFFSPVVLIQYKMTKRQCFKKKSNQTKIPMEEDEGDKWKVKSLRAGAFWSVAASLRLKTELARLVIFPLLYITHVLPYSVPPFPVFFLQQQQLYRIGKELFFLDRHVCVYIRPASLHVSNLNKRMPFALVVLFFL